ncbi:hypothetical protein AVV02_gp199 [Bacillus phage AvesoBmore]|uniref:Uncharacterized protein n=1 Tax=Bacillus phage AvesoBmore TaxID=1698451 RepID=A0A0K2D109_9CAUD|nr:hypothetical protein AVV02_gp199 [Bacillus phage AvesoBmore]ALA13362.1 hypothetical protein AVESOBMORE_199 [Bacillus phage AvesoBmore]
MSLEDKIKQQNALEDDIAMSQDLSYELGKQIYKEFEELPQDKILEYYDMMNIGNASIVRYEIFKKFIYGNEALLGRFEK